MPRTLSSFLSELAERPFEAALIISDTTATKFSIPDGLDYRARGALESLQIHEIMREILRELDIERSFPAMYTMGAVILRNGQWVRGQSRLTPAISWRSGSE